MIDLAVQLGLLVVIAFCWSLSHILRFVVMVVNVIRHDSRGDDVCRCRRCRIAVAKVVRR
jgi:hypothetical protein